MKDDAIGYRTAVLEKFEQKVISLEQLNEALKLLEELRDKEGNMDQLYKPIEDMYSALRYDALNCASFKTIWLFHL